MKTYDVHNEKGEVYAFEVDNLLINRHELCKVVGKIPNVKITRFPKSFFSSFREEDFCTFEVNDCKFIAVEPFGDNDCYLILTDSLLFHPELDTVKEAFNAHKISVIRSLMGCIGSFGGSRFYNH